MAIAKQEQAATPAINPAERYDLVKEGAIVLFEYRGNVESGNVIYVQGTRIGLVWLEGYKSRNEDLQVHELLSVWDKKGPWMAIFPFTGTGHLFPAGRAWLEKHPNPTDRREFQPPSNT